MNEKLAKEIQKAALKALVNLLTNKQVQQQAMAGVEHIYHKFQVKAGKVNLHPQEQAIEIALNTCLRKDQDSQEKVAAFVIALYLQHRIERAAQVGGSLLKRFGKSWFPHIRDRELKFALDVDAELEMFLLNQIQEQSTNGAGEG